MTEEHTVRLNIHFPEPAAASQTAALNSFGGYFLNNSLNIFYSVSPQSDPIFFFFIHDLLSLPVA